ncbi:MAG: transposase [Phenylobacterium sp.]|uniref:integrase catalytic domain-containing protein n=1 Tax=Phenylobacterium sp. TaxID=1871053 RepID=UPI00121E2020|nr:transposase family protein [Phenylobacterium sp.]TAJ72124.1 MAG: transposase [Phenylobacterium sp.]
MARNLFPIAVGDRVIVDGTQLVLHSMAPSKVGAPHEPDIFQFKDPRIDRVVTFPQAAFLKLYNQNKVRILGANEWISDRPIELWDDEGRLDASAALAVEKARRRLQYLQAYDQAPVSRSTEQLRRFIHRVASTLPDPKPPSPGALRRWISERGEPDDRRLSEMADRRPRGLRALKLDERVEAIVEEEAEAYWNNIRVNLTEVWHRVEARVRKELASAEGIARPALSTISLRLRQMVTVDRACRRWGKREGLRRFGLVKGAMEAESILDIGVIDHTTLDCWVIDDRTGQPIGRPRLTVLLDSCSRYPLGFHVGWRDASLEAVMACLRHAARTKDYLRERYPGIRNAWLAYGLPRTIVCDQGLEFMGRSFEDTCATLGISIQPAPVRTPEYKGQVERLFGTIRQGLLDKLPGSVPLRPQLMKEFGIDPEKTAVIYLSEIDELIHRFVCDVYAVEVHRGLGAPPGKVWRDHAKTDIIELARDLALLDRACATVTTGKLTKEGIKLHRLVYRSEALADLRLHLARGGTRSDRSNGSMRVKIAYREDDVSQVSVWDPVLNDYIDVPCTDAAYTKGLSLSLHRMIRAWCDETNREFQTAMDRLGARDAFYERIDEFRARGVIARKRLQRVRHGEREVRGDLVRLVETTAPGSLPVPTVNEVGVDTARNRVDGHHLEPRARLGGRARKRPTKGVNKPTTASSRHVETDRTTSSVGDANWTSLVSRARQAEDR